MCHVQVPALVSQGFNWRGLLSGFWALSWLPSYSGVDGLLYLWRGWCVPIVAGPVYWGGDGCEVRFYWAGPVLVQLITCFLETTSLSNPRMTGFKTELTIHVQLPVLESNNHCKCGRWTWGKKDDKAARPPRKPHCRSQGKMSTASGFALLHWAVHNVVVASRSVISTPFSRYDAW